MQPIILTNKTALITGAARRIGAAATRSLHGAGMNIVLHYRSSSIAAENLRDELNNQRANSVILAQGDLLDTSNLPFLVEQAIAQWGRLDLIVNNASSFFPTPLDVATEDQWEDLIGTNLKTPFFLAQAAIPYLRETQGCIINMVDIHAQRPMDRYPIYCAAKAGLVMLTYSLAQELGPQIRVNGIAPGAILWPEQSQDTSGQAQILSRVALARTGNPEEVARTILFLVRDGTYITGQIIAVDGGRSLFM